MNPHKLKLEASLLIKDDCQHCLQELQQKLSVKNGIEKVHLTSEPPQLCLHFDPNLVSMSAVERMARDAGGELESKFHHQRFRLLSQHSADFVSGLEHQLSQTTGVLHASVNAAASVIFIAYDSEQTGPEELERALHSGGVSVEVLEQPGRGSRHHGEDHRHEAHVHEDGKPCDHDHEHEHEHDHDHGHSHGPGCGHGVAPSFLPAWLQDRWQIALVVACGVFFLTGWLGAKFALFPGQVSLALYLLAYLAGGYDIGTHAIPGLFKGRFNTDILMLAAAVGAGVLGQWAEGSFLLFLFALGHAGEHYAMDRARNAIGALGELMPQKALLRRGGDTVEVPISAVKLGDVALVRPGDRIPVDGVVKSGTTSVDQSPITGESAPVGKEAGDQVFAGTINLETAIEVTVEKTAEDSTLSRVIQMVSEAQEQKSPTQDFTQRFTSRFVPAVLILTLLVIVVPPFMGWMAPRDSFYRAMLLLVACSPCALALGTPASVLAGIGQAARNGILIKGGLHLENLGTLQVIAFDKTGTLTQGKFQLTDVVAETADGEEDLLILAASVEQQSNHPLAQAVVEHAKAKGLILKSSEPLQNLTGFGVRSELDGGTAWLGSRRLFAEVEGAPRLKEAFEATVVDLEEQGKTVIVVGHGDTVMGVLALADTPRQEAKETLKKLSDIGLKHLVMLTGDNRKAAAYVGGQLGVTDVRSELLPEDKWKAGKALQEEHGLLAMVGDGVNDAPALAAADVGIAMGGAGTAVALETADVALMGDDLSKLPYAVGLSRQSRRIIRQNLFISMGVIAGLMVSSLAGWGDLSWTVVFHEGSTLVVVANSLRLLSFRA